MIVYFGEPWDAPAFDGDIFQVLAPIDATCLFCPEGVIEGDRGFMQAAGAQAPAAVPIHRECQLRSVLGGLEHLQGLCEYTGHCHVLRREAGRSLREDALAVWDWVERRRGDHD